MPRPLLSAPLLNRELIINTALQLVAESGLEALNMRALARTLKVTPSSLYHYFPSKNELLAAAYSQVLRVTFPLLDPSASWQHRLHLYADSMRQMAAAYPTISRYMWAPKNPIPEEFLWVEFVARAIHDAGISEEYVMAMAYHFVDTLVVALLWSIHAEDDKGRQTTIRSFIQENSALYPFHATLLPRTGPPVLPVNTQVEMFIYGLQQFIDSERIHASCGP